MDKTTELFIRACKSANPRKRVESVYRRTYLSCSDKEMRKEIIANILTGIVQTYCKPDLCRVLSEMSPQCDWKREDTSFFGKQIEVMINFIRYKKVDSFKGLTKPTKFRSMT